MTALIDEAKTAVPDTGTEAPPHQVPPTLYAALIALQADLPDVTKRMTADVEHRNGGRHTYDYASLEDVTDALLPRLSKVGLGWFTRPLLRDDGKFVLRYKLIHVSGEDDGGDYPLGGATPQARGGEITYARRYALLAVTGLAPHGEDDDANQAQKEAVGRMSAGAAFDQASPARPPQRPAPAAEPVLVPLAPEDPWRDKIGGIETVDDGAKVRAEVARMRDSGDLPKDRADLLDLHITARGRFLFSAATQHAATPAGPPPRVRAEDQGRPGQVKAGENEDWAFGFLANLARCQTDTEVNALQKTLPKAITDRKIAAETATDYRKRCTRRKAELADDAAGRLADVEPQPDGSVA